MRPALVVLLVLLVLVSHRLWLSDDGLPEVWRLKRAVAGQTAENELLRVRNRELEAEVIDLKEGLAAIEERARSELGMTQPNESFYQVVERPAAAGAAD